VRWNERSRRSSSSMAFMTQRRVSVATWSLRLRAVCSFLAASPMRSVKSRSTNVWMSSAPAGCTFPASMSAAMPASPAQIAPASAWLMMPHWASIRAWTWLARMSSLYRRQSNPSEE